MKLEENPPTFFKKRGDKNFSKLFTGINRECSNCSPVTPLECISSCNLWKIRNELRKLQKTLDNPNFMKNLLNTLKNDTRIHLLHMLSKHRYRIEKIQKEAKDAGFSHSQETLKDEYLNPLIESGLLNFSNEHFFDTTLGIKLAELIGNIPEFAEILPSHSECYEEIILIELNKESKTFEQIKELIPVKIIPRILRRLKKGGLVSTSEGRDYIFFFKSKRDVRKEKLSGTEKGIYLNIPYKGISAKKLAESTECSLRLIYKYVRKLKGKKLVFTRRNPKTYSLTEQGERLAWMLNELNKLVEETLCVSNQMLKINGRHK